MMQSALTAHEQAQQVSVLVNVCMQSSLMF